MTHEDTLEAQPLVVFSSRGFRIFETLGCVMGLMGLGVGLFGVLTEGRASLYMLLNVLMGAGYASYFGWLAYFSWRRPVFYLGADEIRWNPKFVRQGLRIPTAEVACYRWPYPRDLWIERADGQRLRIDVGGISRHDKDRLRNWLSARWDDRGVVV
jgi:hypothetical protein